MTFQMPYEKAGAVGMFWGSFVPISTTVEVTDVLKQDLRKRDF